MSCGDSDSSGSDSGEEFEEPGIPVRCLFCEENSDDMTSCIAHINRAHNFTVESFLSKHLSNTYDLVRIITYIRSFRPAPSELPKAPLSQPPWMSEEFLKPVDSSDPWLWTDFDFLDEKDDADFEPKYVNAENGVITLSKEHFDELQKTNQELQRLLREKDRQLEKLRNLMNESENPPASSERPGDSSYFTSYASYDIHREMLSDGPRMEAFRKLFECSEIFQGKTVLDVGCRTGILSMMAVTAGASSVVGVDDSDILYTAMEIVAENSMDSKIRLVKSRVENLELEERVDVIVSEWMGYFLLFEGMLSSVIDARERFLKPDGQIFPRNCTLHLVGVCDPDSRDARLCAEFCGYKMSPLRESALKEASVEVVAAGGVVTNTALVHSFDVLTAKKEDACYFSSDFTLTATKEADLTAVCGYFNCDFMPAAAHLSTSPLSPATHWKQTVFYLAETVKVREGDPVNGRVSVEPTSESARSLIVKLSVSGREHVYRVE